MSTTNIVMLAKDRTELTFQALTMLYRHTPNKDFSLVIVDDQSRVPLVDWTSDTWGTMRHALGTHDNLTVLRVEKSKGITGQVRNLGVYWSERFFGRGDWLYLSDSDVYFCEGWLQKLKQIMVLQPDFKLVGGSTHPFHGVNQTYHIGLTEVRTHDAVSGYSHLMRWETWDKYGPHDAHAKGIRQSEDFKFCQDIIADGGLVGTVWPEVVLATGITDTFGEPAVGADQMRRYEGILQE